jgi:ABC-type transport system involved in multi-copper enzyme maturation permease subunit
MGAVASFLGKLRIWPGPILAFDLVTASRRSRYFILRVFYAAALFFTMWVIHYDYFQGGAGDINTVAAFTNNFFGWFGGLQLAAVVLIGPAMSAGTIAQERERKTLDYLYATPLSNLEIVIGKLGGRVMQLVYFVLSGAPVLALAMLLGGISPAALVSLTIITMSTILFVTMLSLAVSACTARARDAVVRAYLLFFCIWVVPLALLALTFASPGYYAWLTPAVKQLVAPNPLFTFLVIFTRDGPWGPVTDPWQPLLELVRNQTLAGGTALVLATVFMRRFHQRESGRPAKHRRLRMQLYRGQVGDDPMLWKELYAEPGASKLGLLGYGLLALIFVGLCGLTVYLFLEFQSRNSYYRSGAEEFCQYAITMSTFLCCCGLLLSTARAAGAITSEKDRDCWVSLISTPLAAREIVKAKIIGSLWSLRGLAPFVAVVWLPAVILRPSYIWGIAGTLAEMAILAVFTSSFGVYCSIRAKTTIRAVCGALAITILVGGGYLCCCVPLIAMNSHSGPDDDAMGFVLAPCMPALLFEPGYLNWEINANHRSSNREFTMFTTACVLGTIGYLVAALVMPVVAVGQFDEKSGRTQRRPGLAPRPPPVARRVD